MNKTQLFSYIREETLQKLRIHDLCLTGKRAIESVAKSTEQKSYLNFGIFPLKNCPKISSTVDLSTHGVITLAMGCSMLFVIQIPTQPKKKPQPLLSAERRTA